MNWAAKTAFKMCKRPNIVINGDLFYSICWDYRAHILPLLFLYKRGRKCSIRFIQYWDSHGWSCFETLSSWSYTLLSRTSPFISFLFWLYPVSQRPHHAQFSWLFLVSWLEIHLKLESASSSLVATINHNSSRWISFPFAGYMSSPFLDQLLSSDPFYV